MPLPTIVPYLALLTFLYLALSVHVIRTRGAARVSLGTEGHETLLRATRAHGNFMEYVPLAFLLLWLLEYTEFNGIIITLLSALLVIARTSHAYGILIAEPARQRLRCRVLGMVGTFSVLGISAALLMYSWLLLYFGAISV